MKIVFFHWSANNAPSITRSFAPYINELRKTEEVEEYRVPYLGANPINMLRNIVFVHKHRTREGVNHITGDIHYCILGLIGVKSVLTIHDDYAIKKAPSWLNRIFKWLFWLFMPIKLADKVVCISDETLKNIKKYVKRNDMTVITQHSFPKEYQNNPYTFNKSKPRILQIGATEQKNLETTIKVLQGLNCELRVIKKMYDHQKKMADELGLEWSNAYNLTDEEILEEYKKSDVVVFPSLFEGFGMPIIESQAVGRPVITSNRAPMNWVAGEKAALLNNPTDVEEYRSLLLKIINDDEYRASLIGNGLENAKRFDVNNIVKKYKELYLSI